MAYHTPPRGGSSETIGRQAGSLTYAAVADLGQRRLLLCTTMMQVRAVMAKSSAASLPMNLNMPSLILNHLRISRFKDARRALVRGILTLPSPLVRQGERVAAGRVRGVPRAVAALPRWEPQCRPRRPLCHQFLGLRIAGGCSNTLVRWRARLDKPMRTYCSCRPA